MKTQFTKFVLVIMLVALSACAKANTPIPIATYAAATEAPMVENGNEALEPFIEAPAATQSAPIATSPLSLPNGAPSTAEEPLLPTVVVPAPGNGLDNTFQDYGVNPPVNTSRDNLSTFGLDVDTASYEITRTYIDQGALPPMDAVRAEEFINAFDQGYASPEGSAFTVYADGGPSPFIDDENYLVRFGVQGYSVPDSERKPLNLTFVIDSSGSMADGDRLEMVKYALRLLVSELDERDTVTIVKFSTDAWMVLRPTNASDQRTIEKAIDSLYPMDSTNADAGLQLGYRYAYRMLNPDAVNRVILCSDGVANVGNVSVDSMLEYIREFADEGITLTGIGVGMGNYNDVLLEQLADNGDGNYYYINSRDEARDLFVYNLTSTMQVIGYDAKIQIDFNPEVVEEYRLIGYENRAIADEDFRDDSVDAGEVGAGMTAAALYEIKLKDGAQGRIATAQLRWQDADSLEVREISGDFFTTDLASAFKETSPYFQLASTVAAYAEILRVSPYVQGSLADVAKEADRIAILMMESKDAEDFSNLAWGTVDVDRYQH